MSMRESRVLSKFINEEFSFLSEEMERNDAEHCELTTTEGTTENVTRSVRLGNSNSQPSITSDKDNNIDLAEAANIKTVRLGSQRSADSCLDSVEIHGDSDSEMTEAKSVMSDDLRNSERAVNAYEDRTSTQVADIRVQSVDSGVGLISLSDDSSLCQADSVKDIPINTSNNIPEDTVMDVPEDIVGNVPNVPVDNVPVDNVPDATVEDVLDVTIENVPDAAVKNVPGVTGDDVQYVPVENVSEGATDNVTETTAENVAGDAVVNIRVKGKAGSMESIDGDTYDDDKGVYDESFRGSKWIFVKDEESDDEKLDSAEDTNSITSEESESSKSQEGYEYRRSYKQVSFKKVQRQSSLQTFAMEQTSEVSAEKKVTLTKSEGEDGLGFHIGGNCPTLIGHVVAGSIAEKAGLEVGDVLLAINYERVLTNTLEEIVDILRNAMGPLTIELCKESSLTMMSQEQKETCNEIYSAYMYKLVNSTFGLWKRRWFVLKSDNCLYYYKDRKDKEILGAIPLSGYTVQKAIDMKRAHSIKLMHRTKTYYFAAANEEDLMKWAKLLTEATQTESTMDNWVAVSSHHVSLPSYAIKNMDCDGFLHKLGGHHKSWKRRYCVLKDGCLFYYCEVNSRCAQGVAHLHGYTTIANPPSNKRNAFELSPPNPKMRTFHFYADTQMEKDRWIRAMKLSISRWVQVKE